MNIKNFQSILALLILLASCSGGGNADGPVNPGGEEPGTVELKVVDGKVRFYVTNAESSPRVSLGIIPSSYAKYKVRVNGADFPVSVDSDGESYVDVPVAADGKYTAVLYTSKSSSWCGSSFYSDIILPYSQFYKATALAMADMPQYASYALANGNKLKFNDGFALLDIVLKGSAKVSSVKVADPGKSILAGVANFLPSKDQFQMKGGLPFVTLNCTDDGNYAPLSQEGTHFFVPIAPGTYSSGLKIRVCDSDHRMMEIPLPSCTLSAGEVKEVSADYAPEENLIWFEGFDNCVWGGDIIGGSSATGYAPDGKKLGIQDGTDRTGYENAFTAVSYEHPGSGFIQSDTWTEVSGKNLGTSHQMSLSYVKSRNFQDWTYLFRCQEYQGCIAVGAGSLSRGIMRTPSITNLSGIATVKVTFDLCFQAGSTDALEFNVVNGGVIASCSVNGENDVLTEDNSEYLGAASAYILSHTKAGIPASAASPKSWCKVEVVIDRATDGTQLHFSGRDVSSGVHGFYVDDIRVAKVKDMPRPANSLRVLYWNIQNGMWSDQGDGYKNFVAFVKKYDPDVCVWCEASTNYATNSSASAPSSERFLPDGWATLAARYGHPYAALGGKRDNFPQEITSKYKITTLARITDSDVTGKPVSHGAALHGIDVGGKSIYFVTLHLWPQAYGFGVTGTAAREASAALFEGDYYRQFEMRYLLKTTVGNSDYTSQGNWLMMGDFNARSRLDDWYYKETNPVKYLVHDEVLGGTDMKDIIALRYPGMFMSSTGGNSRIDYMYASPAMYDRVENAMVLIDKWTTISKSPYGSNFYDPSDHRPILVDFRLD